MKRYPCTSAHPVPLFLSLLSRSLVVTDSSYEIKGPNIQFRPVRSTQSPWGPPPRHRPGERFLKGPIPLNWLGAAASLPGKALHVAIELWFWAGVKNSRTVAISLSHLRATRIHRSSASRGLQALERAGLVAVVRHSGRKPIVTLLDYDAEETGRGLGPMGPSDQSRNSGSEPLG
jgi:hypothetical protein